MNCFILFLLCSGSLANAGHVFIVFLSALLRIFVQGRQFIHDRLQESVLVSSFLCLKKNFNIIPSITGMICFGMPWPTPWSMQ